MSTPETVVVNVRQARNLPKMDLIGSIDSYVILKYGDTSKKTETQENTKSPVFSQTFDFEYDPSLGDEILIELWDWDKISKDDLVATSKITIPKYKNKKKTEWFPLTSPKGKKAGELQLEVIYNSNEEVSTRAFDLGSGGIQEKILEYVKSKPFLIQLIHFLYTSLIWQNFITYGIVVAITLLNYYFIVVTNWRTLPYFFFLGFEFYIIFFIFTTYTKFLSQPEDEAEASTSTVTNYIFNIRIWNGKNPLDDVKALENFQKTPYYTPTVIIVFLLLLALISSIFSGAFVSFVLVFGFLLWPGITTKGYDVQFVNWWVPNIWTPHLQPLYETKIKPALDNLLQGKGGAAAAAAPAVGAPSST